MLNLNDKKTWNLFKEGRTKGIFQLESQLGRTWSKKVAPTSIEDLSALISIIRPGTLKAMQDGKSMTQHYVDRKHGRDKVEYLHPSLEPILKTTFGVLVYQEQAMLIAKILAGFNLKEADELRKAIGKKKADVMAKVKVKFIEGCNKVGIVTADVAAEIFGWIEKSARYSFNKCLDPTTTVITPDGDKMLCDLKAGDTVLAPLDEQNDYFVEVLDVIDNGIKELYEVETDTGHSITCTLDHKFLCIDGVTRPLMDILEGDFEILVYN